MNYYSNNSYVNSLRCLPLLNSVCNGGNTAVLNGTQPTVTVTPLPNNIVTQNNSNQLNTSSNTPVSSSSGTTGTVALVTYTIFPTTISQLSINNVSPNPIPVGSTNIIPGTITVVANYSSTPIINIGGICYDSTKNNGKFTIPVSGIYNITCTASYVSNPNGTRSLYLYQISGSSGSIILRAVSCVNAVNGQPTSINISSVLFLATGDQIFIAGSQTSDQNGLDITSGTQLGIVLITPVSQ
jgi:hypothetical protein